MPSPLSRYRIYGGPLNYARSLGELATFRWNSGDDVTQMERQFAERFGTAEAIACPLARVGLYLVIKHLIRPGEQVLMSPYTIADVVNMVIVAGGVPRFVDVDLQTGNMDPEALRTRIAPGCGAVLVTHLHGITARIEEILAIARGVGLPVVEDNAQALGARTTDGFTGTLGDAGILSFGSYKNINSWFGGLVLTRHGDLSRRIRDEVASWQEFPRPTVLRKMAQSALVDVLGWEPLFSPAVSRLFRHGFLHDVDWINKIAMIELDTFRRERLPDWFQSRFSAGQARRVLEQLPRLERHGQLRIEKAARYDAGIAELPGTVKPPPPQDGRNVYTYYPLRVQRRTNLLKWMMHFRRDIAAQHLKNCAHLESFKAFAHPCPAAEQVANSVLLLPTYPGYRGDEVQKNIDVLQWYQQNGEPEFLPGCPRAAAPLTTHAAR